MLAGLTLLLVFQLVGEILVQVFALPIPGPVIGMALLFLALVARGGAARRVREAGSALLQHLSLLFVPAGVGVMVHAARIGDEWLPILVSLVVSTVLSMTVTALVLRLFLARTQRKAQ